MQNLNQLRGFGPESISESNNERLEFLGDAVFIEDLGSANGGVYRSTDGGNSFALTSSAFGAFILSFIC